MNEINDSLEYAQMLEIPVSTVNVVKKRSLFSRKAKPQDDLKDSVIGTVNSRVDEGAEPLANGGFVQTEDLSAPVLEQPAPATKKGGVAGKIIMCEAVAACLIAAGIFVTNIFVKNTVINTFMGSLTHTEKAEAAYTDFTLSPVTSELTETDVTVTPEGVICFEGATNVYPVCDGKVAAVTNEDGKVTVKVAHTSTFTSVVTGLDNCYYSVGDEVKGNIPFAHSDGTSQVRVSMYDGDNLLNCYSLSGVVPVWNS